MLKNYAIPLLLVTVVLFITTILYKRLAYDRLCSRQRKYEHYINTFLTKLIFSNQTYQENKTLIQAFKSKTFFKEKWCKELLIKQLLKIKTSTQLENNKQILIVYKLLELDQYSRKLIDKDEWYLKSMGIYHYQMFDYRIKKARIKPFLESKNKYLQSNALVAHFALSDHYLDDLSTYTHHFSAPDTIKILDLLTYKQHSASHTATHLLHSSNSLLVILGIKILIKNKQLLSLSNITYLLLHPQASVRYELIYAIKELVIHQSNHLLMEHYIKENNHKNKIAILEALAVIGNKETLAFASQKLITTPDLDLKFYLVKCIHALQATFFNTFTTPVTPEEKVIQKILLHIKNPYLN